ncbi:MAG TPA: hypothetical protein DD856_08725 [Sulfobacillus sp.]|nr:hypothetical protein [Sulfobacillus sp.]
MKIEEQGDPWIRTPCLTPFSSIFRPCSACTGLAAGTHLGSRVDFSKNLSLFAANQNRQGNPRTHAKLAENVAQLYPQGYLSRGRAWFGTAVYPSTSHDS